MKSGVTAICMASDVVAQVAGMRTLPSARMTLSSIMLKNVITMPPRSTRANCVAPACTAPLAPMRRKSAGDPAIARIPNPTPRTTQSRSACPASAAASARRAAPCARAIAEAAPAPMPPPIEVSARRDTGNTRDTAPMASTPIRLT